MQPMGMVIGIKPEKIEEYRKLDVSSQQVVQLNSAGIARRLLPRGIESALNILLNTGIEAGAGPGFIHNGQE